MIRFLKNSIKKLLGKPVSYEGLLNKNKTKYIDGHQLNENPLVSVIMPCWNRADIIHKSIESVLDQTYQNFELIIVDDGSSDDSINVISNYNSDKIQLIKCSKVGVSKARNEGLRCASGIYFCYLDSDDLWDQYYLEVMLKVALDSNANCLYSGIQVNDLTKDKNFIRLSDFDQERLKKENFIPLISFFHHRIVYDTLGGFNEKMNRLVDWEMFIRYASKYDFYKVNTVLAQSFIHDSLNNITLKNPVEPNMKIVAETIEKYYG